MSRTANWNRVHTVTFSEEERILTEDCINMTRACSILHFCSLHRPFLMAAARFRSYYQIGCTAVGFTLPAAHPQICSSKELTGEIALPWSVGDPEDKRKMPSSLKRCRQLKKMLKGYLEMFWTRLFVFYLL